MVEFRDHLEIGRSDVGVGIVSELEAMSVEIDYSVMQFGPQVWGIRGHIAYDGDVLAAVFPSEHDAWIALAPLRPGHERSP
jgi:hypothetical protein